MNIGIREIKVHPKNIPKTMSSLHLYNTLSQKLELFQPITEGHVGIYICGPTVYGPPHLGHVRGPIVFDVLRRYLIHNGYNVRFVRNITDVGHLVGDFDGGEDKLLKQAKVEKLEPMEVAQTYTNAYNAVMDKMNIIKPSIEPRATGHIIEQIEMIQAIMDAGLAYTINGSVYFDVIAYNTNNNYGVLSGRILEDLQSGHDAISSGPNFVPSQGRALESQNEKRNPSDFALWKKASPEHLMQWNSSWGKGFPGWHIECSAMSAKYLGAYFDIHGGGLDLLFPHHEAEIAQGIVAHKHTPAKYWIHHNMITIAGQKMAKSLGNGVLAEQLFNGSHALLDQPYSPMTLRFFVLQAHYRGTLDFSNNALLAAQKAWQRMQSAINLIDNLKVVDGKGSMEVDDIVLGIRESMNDDLNTPQVIAHLFELCRRINLVNDGKDQISLRVKTLVQQLRDDVCFGFLGLILDDKSNSDGLNDAMQILLDLRKNAKKENNWVLGDQIRDALKEKGFEIKDTPEGTVWKL